MKRTSVFDTFKVKKIKMQDFGQVQVKIDVGAEVDAEKIKVDDVGKKEIFTTFLQELVCQAGVRDLNTPHCLKKILKSCNFDSTFLDNYLWDFKDHVDWDDISDLRLESSFIRKYKNKLNWSRICKYQKMSESFLIEHIEFLNWNRVSIYQILTESFIEKYKKELNWTSLFIHQKLSKTFIQRHQSFLNGRQIFKQEMLLKAIQLHLKPIETVEENYSDSNGSILSIDTNSFCVTDDE